MPNIMGNRNPASPPANPTMPVTVPILSGKSSATYLKVDAMPNAKTAPSTNRIATNSHIGMYRWNVDAPSSVLMLNWVSGYDSRNRQTQATQRHHHVTRCAPNRSASPPPTARNMAPGNEKPAARAEAAISVKPYSP